MRIIYIPLDERPCNTTVVELIAQSDEEVQLVLPPSSLYGYKKKAAQTQAIWLWLQHEATQADAIILSIDMLLYGGLVPSRLHHFSDDVKDEFIANLKQLHVQNKHVPIYAFTLIMRTPKYSSSDEEPDYYEQWGREIFLRAYLTDKQQREHLSESEQLQLEHILNTLPEAHVKDYEVRRQFNSSVNISMLDLVNEGVLKFLAIPQDDSAEFGYTAVDQQKVLKHRSQLRLTRNVQMYPGADEAGATLLARAYNDLKQEAPSIYVLWSSTLGPQLIPMYEDRPFAESMKAHVLAAGCKLVDSMEKADIVLAYNVPGRVMQESWDQYKKDMTYLSFRNLLTFINQIKDAIDSNKPVIVADCAYANGGDYELLSLLDSEGLLDKLLSYKGWNTNCNTLGTTLGQGVLGYKSKLINQIKYNLVYHLLDDYCYQAEVRMDMVNDYLPLYDLDYFNLKDKASIVNGARNARLLDSFNKLTTNSFNNIVSLQINSNAPWNRMFECGLSLHITWEDE